MVICRFKCFSQQESAISMLLTLKEEAQLLFVRYYIAAPDQQ